MVFLESCRKDFCRKWLNLGSSLKHYIFYFILWTTSLYNQPECLLGNYHSVKLQIICFKLSVCRCWVVQLHNSIIVKLSDSQSPHHCLCVCNIIICSLFSFCLTSPFSSPCTATMSLLQFHWNVRFIDSRW